MDMVGERIKDALKIRNINQKELAYMVDVSEVTMSRYISGTRYPKSDIIKKIANALDVPVSYLVSDPNDEESMYEYNKVFRIIEIYAKTWSNEDKMKLIHLLSTKNEASKL